LKSLKGIGRGMADMVILNSLNQPFAIPVTLSAIHLAARLGYIREDLDATKQRN